MSKSETKEYIRDYTKDLYGLFKHGHRGTEHNIVSINKCSPKCADYKTCQLFEKLNRDRCRSYVEKGYKKYPSGNRIKIK